MRASWDANYITGDTVYYKKMVSKKLKGPGKVIGQDGQQVLIKHGGMYVRVHPCRIMFEKQMSRYPRKMLKRTLVQKSLLQMNLAKMTSLKVVLMKKLKADLLCLVKTAVMCYHLLLNNRVCSLAVPLIIA